MIAILDIIVYWAGLLAGFLYSLSKDTVEAVAAGDTATLTRLLVTLGVVYLALLIVHRTLRMVFSTFMIVVKLAVVALVLATAVYTYAHGVPATIDAAKTFSDEAVSQLHKSAKTLRTAYGANTYLNQLYKRSL